MDGYRSLNAADSVEFDYESAGQDSFRFVATRVRKLQRTRFTRRAGETGNIARLPSSWRRVCRAAAPAANAVVSAGGPC
jgi:hypothetical protein